MASTGYGPWDVTDSGSSIEGDLVLGHRRAAKDRKDFKDATGNSDATHTARLSFYYPVMTTQLNVEPEKTAGRHNDLSLPGRQQLGALPARV